MKWLKELPENRRRGSLPRCLLLKQREPRVVADRLTELVGVDSVRVNADDFWMPKGAPRLEPNGQWDKSAIQEARPASRQDFFPLLAAQAI